MNEQRVSVSRRVACNTMATEMGTEFAKELSNQLMQAEFWQQDIGDRQWDYIVDYGQYWTSSIMTMLSLMHHLAAATDIDDLVNMLKADSTPSKYIRAFAELFMEDEMNKKVLETFKD